MFVKHRFVDKKFINKSVKKLVRKLSSGLIQIAQNLKKQYKINPFRNGIGVIMRKQGRLFAHYKSNGFSAKTRFFPMFAQS